MKLRRLRCGSRAGRGGGGETCGGEDWHKVRWLVVASDRTGLGLEGVWKIRRSGNGEGRMGQDHSL